MQENISLACSECKRKNYTTTKNKKTNTEKLELGKLKGNEGDQNYEIPAGTDLTACADG